MMVFISLVPAGIYQAWASVRTGMWFARSPEVVHSKVMETLVWMRVPGDVVFSVGTLLLALFAWRLTRGARKARLVAVDATAAASAAVTTSPDRA
jgi:nitric oxide reductase subunit B